MRTGEVTVACVISAMDAFVLTVLQRYHARWPNIKVRTVDAGATEVLSAVVQGDAEFGLNFIGAQEPDIDFEPIVREPYVLMCRRDDPMAEKAEASWQELAGRDLIGGWKGSGNRLVLDLALASILPRPRWCYEVRRLSTIPALVEAGLGVAAVPRLLMTTCGHPTLACVPLVAPIVMRTLGLIRKRGRQLSPAARQLYDLIVQAHVQPETQHTAEAHAQIVVA
jgi:DNA-binding transcriptional LysR family regulator